MNGEDGGAAFPQQHSRTDCNGERRWAATGMNLRQYYAAKALTTVGPADIPELAKSAKKNNTTIQAEIARACFLIADVMLKEGAK